MLGIIVYIDTGYLGIGLAAAAAVGAGYLGICCAWGWSQDRKEYPVIHVNSS